MYLKTQFFFFYYAIVDVNLFDKFGKLEDQGHIKK